MSRGQVDSIRDASSGYQSAKRFKKDSPWDTHYEQMGLKTVIRRLCKYLPKSPELATVMAMDDAADKGQAQNININDAIDGTWAPAPDDEPMPTQDAKATPAKPATTIDAETGEIVEEKSDWKPSPAEIEEIRRREAAEASGDGFGNID